jgi:hypothetical protein
MDEENKDPHTYWDNNEEFVIDYEPKYWKIQIEDGEIRLIRVFY